MGRNEYLIFRIISGINDPASVDKLLSIPQADFNLEEVHRVAVACEAAKNYTGLNNRPDNVSCKVSNKGFGQYRSASNTGDDDNAPCTDYLVSIFHFGHRVVRFRIKDHYGRFWVFLSKNSSFKFSHCSCIFALISKILKLGKQSTILET